MKYVIDEVKLALDMATEIECMKLTAREAGILCGVSHTEISLLRRCRAGAIRTDTFLAVCHGLDLEPTDYIVIAGTELQSSAGERITEYELSEKAKQYLRDAH